MNVLYNGTREKKDVPYTYVGDVVELARQSDYLMVACKGGPETRHLVSRAVIDALGPKGTLINVARGTVVDEEALIDALANKRLGWAALDVFENSPNFDQRLLDFPNVILQPHHGTAAIETRTRDGPADDRQSRGRSGEAATQDAGDGLIALPHLAGRKDRKRMTDRRKSSSIKSATSTGRRTAGRCWRWRTFRSTCGRRNSWRCSARPVAANRPCFI